MTHTHPNGKHPRPAGLSATFAGSGRPSDSDPALSVIAGLAKVVVDQRPDIEHRLSAAGVCQALMTAVGDDLSCANVLTTCQKLLADAGLMTGDEFLSALVKVMVLTVPDVDDGAWRQWLGL